VLLAAAAAAVSSPAARFYEAPEVASVLLVLALNFLIVPFGAISQALLVRNMRFGAMAVISVSQALTQAAVTIVLAWRGHGAMSLAWGALASALVSAAVTTLFRPSGTPWMPSLRGLRRVAAFGGPTSLSSLLSDVSDNFPDLLIGRTLGMAETGLFGRAKGYVSLYQRLLMRAIWPVAFPYLAERHRNDAPLAEALQRMTTLLTGLAWPGLAFMALMAGPLILLLYGEQWTAAVPAAQWLCIAAMITSWFAFTGTALMATGKAMVLMRLTLLTLAIKLGAVVLTMTTGITAIAQALVVAAALSALVSMLALNRHLGVAWSTWARPALLGLALTASSLAGPVALLLAWPAGSPILLAIASCLAWGLGLLLGAWLLRHPLYAELLNLVAAVRARLQSSPPPQL